MNIWTNRFTDIFMVTVIAAFMDRYWVRINLQINRRIEE